MGRLGPLGPTVVIVGLLEVQGHGGLHSRAGRGHNGSLVGRRWADGLLDGEHGLGCRDGADGGAVGHAAAVGAGQHGGGGGHVLMVIVVGDVLGAEPMAVDGGGLLGQEATRHSIDTVLQCEIEKLKQGKLWLIQRSLAGLE